MTDRTFLQALQAVHADEAGQAFAEYFLVLTATVIGIGAAFRAFDSAVTAYYQRVITWVTLPIP